MFELPSFFFSPVRMSKTDLLGSRLRLLRPHLPQPRLLLRRLRALHLLNSRGNDLPFFFFSGGGGGGRLEWIGGILCFKSAPSILFLFCLSHEHMHFSLVKHFLNNASQLPQATSPASSEGVATHRCPSAAHQQGTESVSCEVRCEHDRLPRKGLEKCVFGVK